MAVNENTLINAGLQSGLVDSSTISRLKLQARRERIGLLEAVAREGRFPITALYQALADLRGIPFLNSRELRPDSEIIAKLPPNLMQRRLLFPIQVTNGERLLAMADPDDQIGIDSIQRASGQHFQAALADPEALEAAIFREMKGNNPLIETPDLTTDGDSVTLFDSIMKEAYLRRASDVHLEPNKQDYRVRLRVDGHLQEYPRPLSHADGEALMTRLKVLAVLDIAEQRMAQDGGMTYRVSDWDMGEMDIRVATVPTRWGERATLRLLGQETGRLTLEGLGMPESTLIQLREAIHRPHGMILVTGPTGSGKSTTLYAALRELDASEINILTVEDPVEQIIDGVSQIQVTGKLDFAQALRSFLRHDPDVILVGEIRDLETAQTALKASMTGHVVLSTLHTNDAIGAVSRLVDIGAERFLIGSTLIGVMAQRLVRRLCPHCRKSHIAEEHERLALGGKLDPEIELWAPSGCPNCLGTGYLGRVGLYETFWVDNQMRTLIAEGATESEIRKAAKNYHTLAMDGRDKVLSGLTSIDEVSYLNLQGDVHG
ncbi:MAG: type II/IV secretion system protein [Candidatus Nitronauta litoralis]|uniref:Type II/IV secretion system protein n=1 Tax=Candidatus Nitronauta litoralis TaxID=2705533 RepID=A0A7T0BX49_9BACT|nr:MAG: type II/IV secretion system protein [Candidatus Nitronauta litoralis]